MTATTALAPPRWPAIAANTRAASPLLWSLSILLLAFFALLLALPLADSRLFNGIGVWTKPAKFSLSIAVHMLTLAWGISLLPPSRRGVLAVTIPAAIFAVAGLGELAYIAGRAALGQASHFNTTTPTAELLYSLMGAAAVTMMLATGWIGYRILREAPPSPVATAAGWGFIVAMVATIISGLTLGSMGSHWIGGDQTDATGLPVFGWSTTGGDLRVSHFIALHLMQALPLAAYLSGRRLAWAAAISGVAGTAATYALALNGVAVIPY